MTAIGGRKAEYDTHSLRRTKAAMINRAINNIRAVQILLGHTKIDVRFLNVDIEDALLLAKRSEPKSNPRSGRSGVLIDRFWVVSYTS